jgi:hypothetical protein
VLVVRVGAVNLLQHRVIDVLAKHGFDRFQIPLEAIRGELDARGQSDLEVGVATFGSLDGLRLVVFVLRDRLGIPALRTSARQVGAVPFPNLITTTKITAARRRRESGLHLGRHGGQADGSR